MARFYCDFAEIRKCISNSMEKSHVKGPTDNSGIWYKSIDDILKHQANLQPHKEAFVIYTSQTQRESITFGALYERSKHFASVLHDLGIQNRDHVVFYLRNSIEFLVTQFGVILVGAIPVNTFVTAHGSSDLVTTIKKIKPVALVIERSCPGTYTALSDLKAECSSLKHIIATDISNDIDGCLSYHSLLENGSLAQSTTNYEVNPDDVAYVFKTSGSTGKPKYISEAYRNYLYHSLGEVNTVNGKPIKVYSNAYFSYGGGNPLLTINAGITRVTMCDMSDSREIHDSLCIVEREKCNFMVLTLCSAKKILNQGLNIPKSLIGFELGGTPLPKEVGQLLQYVYVLRCVYGLMETGSIANILVKKGEDMEDNIGGYPTENVEIKIVDDEDNIVDIGVTGKILARTPFPCASYMKDDDEQAIVYKDWIDTRDMGYISEKGKIYVRGRDVDCCTFDDVCFFLPEIENTFRDIGIKGIEDIVALPIPDEEFYQRVCVCVIRKTGSSLTESEFIDICKANKLSFILMPKYVFFMDSFPMNVNQKILRKQLLEKVMNDLLPQIV